MSVHKKGTRRHVTIETEIIKCVRSQQEQRASESRNRIFECGFSQLFPFLLFEFD